MTQRTTLLTAKSPVVLFAALCCAFIIAACTLIAPRQALAYYYDYDTANTAQQEVDTGGDPIPGNAIPDGVYLVGARTSSRMCILYPSAEDCSANTNRELCYISVDGGSITAVFYTSKAYTRLCLGTGEYAASLSDETGTNDAPYMVGDPADDYVPHLYTLSVNALNEPIVFATFDGANRSIEEAKWYTRTVAFTPTEDVLRAMRGETGGGQSPAASDDPENAAGGAVAGDGADGSGGGGSDDANGQQEDAGQDEGKSDAAPPAENADPSLKHGIPITIANAGVPVVPVITQETAVQENAPRGLSQAQVLGLLTAAAMAAGCAARVIMFRRSKQARA